MKIDLLPLSWSLLPFACLALTATSAAAAPVAVDPDAPATVVVEPTPAASPAAGDPNLDRGLLQPTAMTQPAGSITYDNYELLLQGVTYAVTDRLQASVTMLSPIIREVPFVALGAVKWRLLGTPSFHLAIQGSLGYGALFVDDDNRASHAYTAGAGVLASYCLRGDCSSLLSASAIYQLASETAGDHKRSRTIIYGGSIVHRVSRHIKLLGEITTVAVADSSSESTDTSSTGGALASYGVRFFTGDIASDVGFVKPVLIRGSDPFLLGIPFVNVSCRWQ